MKYEVAKYRVGEEVLIGSTVTHISSVSYVGGYFSYAVHEPVGGTVAWFYEEDIKPIEKTDLQRFIELYKDFGVSEEEMKVFKDHMTNHTEVRLCVDDKDKIQGYYGFGSSLYFDGDGKFINQEIYE